MVNTVRAALHAIGEIVEATPSVGDAGTIPFEFTVASSADEGAFAPLAALVVPSASAKGVGPRMRVSDRLPRFVGDPERLQQVVWRIAPEFLPHVFERFQQADASASRRHGGLGLGLALVRQIVELHGGTACAESAGPGRGASFSVRLPYPPGFVGEAPACEETRRARHAAGPAGRPGHDGE